MNVDKVSRNMLRQIKPKMMAVFTLPSIKACMSARVMAAQLKRIDGISFTSRIDYENKQIIFLRNENLEGDN